MMNHAGGDRILSMPLNESFPILDKLAWELANEFESKPVWVRADEAKRHVPQRPGRYEIDSPTKEAAELAKIKREMEELREKMNRRERPQRVSKVQFEEPLEYTEAQSADVCTMFGLQ